MGPAPTRPAITITPMPTTLFTTPTSENAATRAAMRSGNCMDDVLRAERHETQPGFERTQELQRGREEHDVVAADVAESRRANTRQQFAPGKQDRVFVEGALLDRPDRQRIQDVVLEYENLATRLEYTPNFPHPVIPL